MQGHRATLGGRRRQGGGEGGGVVDDQHVTWIEERRQIGEAGVEESVLAPVGDEQADAIAGDAAGFGRLVGFQVGGEDEVQHRRSYGAEGGHQGTPAGARPGAGGGGVRLRCWPREQVAGAVAPGGEGSPVIRRRKAGATASGEGRSLRSTPGSASRCMAVSMSPGSTA